MVLSFNSVSLPVRSRVILPLSILMMAKEPDEASGAARLGRRLEDHQIAPDTLGAQHFRPDLGGSIGRIDGAGQPGELSGQLVVRLDDGAQHPAQRLLIDSGNVDVSEEFARSISGAAAVSRARSMEPSRLLVIPGSSRLDTLISGASV